MRGPSCPNASLKEPKRLSVVIEKGMAAKLSTGLPKGPMMKAAASPQNSLAEAYGLVRAHTEELAAPLSAEDCALQSMPDASPVKWHLAHTTWFFETVILAKQPGYKPADPRFAYLFNSYYEALGPRHPRPRRGLLSRPSLDEIYAYRARSMRQCYRSATMPCCATQFCWG
jgi:hypothetical protein